MLWKLGYEHGDPSLSNLMVDPKTKCGVLNDWDLSYVNSEDSQGHVGGERTGTIPFMALDLLCDDYWQGKITRHYRHDLEGLIWVLPWVFLQFDGSERKNWRFDAWSTGDYEICRKEKLDALVNFNSRDNTAQSWESEWTFALMLLSWLRRERFLRSDAATFVLQPDKSDTDVYSEFCGVLEETCKKYSPLNGLLSSLQMAAALL